MEGFYQGKDVTQYAENNHSGPWIELGLERVSMDIYSQGHIFSFLLETTTPHAHLIGFV